MNHFMAIENTEKKRLQKGAEEKRLSSAARFPGRKLVPHLHAEKIDPQRCTSSHELRCLRISPEYGILG